MRPNKVRSQHSHSHISGNEGQLQTGTMQLSSNAKRSAQPFNPMFDLFSYQASGWIQNPISSVEFRKFCRPTMRRGSSFNWSHLFFPEGYTIQVERDGFLRGQHNHCSV